jgi:hypothetical protein
MGMLVTSRFFTDLSSRAATMVTDSKPADDSSAVTAISAAAGNPMGVEGTDASGFSVTLPGFTVNISGAEGALLFYCKDSD